MTDEIWKIVVPAVLGSSVLSAFLAHHFSIRRDKNSRKLKAKYLATELAFQFERYAMRSADALADSKNYVSSNGHAGAALASVLSFDEIPESDYYELLPTILLEAVYQFQDEIAVQQYYFKSAFDFMDGEDVVQEAMKQTMRHGSKALAVATMIRKNQKLPLRTMKFDAWDIAGSLSNEN